MNTESKVDIYLLTVTSPNFNFLLRIYHYTYFSHVFIYCVTYWLFPPMTVNTLLSYKTLPLFLEQCLMLSRY
jgi:hypothetical protein